MSQSSSAVAPPVEQVFLRLKRPDGEIRISLVRLSGRDLLSVRHFYNSADGDLRPNGRRGIALHAAEAEAVGLAILAIAESHGKPQAGASTPVETTAGA